MPSMPSIATTGIQIKSCGIQTRKKKWHCMNKIPSKFYAVFYYFILFFSLLYGHIRYGHEVLSPGSARQIYFMILDLLSV